MIPKKIHYCWFGRGKLPDLAVRCIDSWKKYLPNYEIIEWNEDNYDIEKNNFMKEAYKCKKYAFVSDYARFDILYNEGGIYFDTDVELIKNVNDIIEKSPFISMEQKGSVNAGLGLGSDKGHPIYKEILDYYSNIHYCINGKIVFKENIVTIVTRIFQSYGLQDEDRIQNIDGILVYPTDYFCPKSIITGKITLTQNSRAIHHYDGSWLDVYTKKIILEKEHISDTYHNALLLVFLRKYIVLKYRLYELLQIKP